MFLGRMYKKNEHTFPVNTIPGLEESDATISIRLLTPGERRDVADSATRLTYEPTDGGSLESKLEGRLGGSLKRMFELAVVGWTGIYADADGADPLAFGAAGKKKILSMCPDLAIWVAKWHDEMVSEELKAKEPERKNS